MTASRVETDPFEPQPGRRQNDFPLLGDRPDGSGYVELA